MIECRVGRIPNKALHQKGRNILSLCDSFVLHFVTKTFDDANDPLKMPGSALIFRNAVIVVLLRPINYSTPAVRDESNTSMIAGQVYVPPIFKCGDHICINAVRIFVNLKRLGSSCDSIKPEVVLNRPFDHIFEIDIFKIAIEMTEIVRRLAFRVIDKKCAVVADANIYVAILPHVCSCSI